MTAKERQELLEAVASARSTFKSLQRVARAAIQVAADLEERIETFERHLALADHTAQGGHSDDDRTETIGELGGEVAAAVASFDQRNR